MEYQVRGHPNKALEPVVGKEGDDFGIRSICPMRVLKHISINYLVFTIRI